MPTRAVVRGLVPWQVGAREGVNVRQDSSTGELIEQLLQVLGDANHGAQLALRQGLGIAAAFDSHLHGVLRSLDVVKEAKAAMQAVDYVMPEAELRVEASEAAARELRRRDATRCA